MDNEEQLETLYAMWRNPVINDTYEPGSTFKLITTTAARGGWLHLIVCL